MNDPADQPTIDQLLRDFGIDDFFSPKEYSELLASLEQRDNIMRTDAAKYESRKATMAALKKIIEEV